MESWLGYQNSSKTLEYHIQILLPLVTFCKFLKALPHLCFVCISRGGRNCLHGKFILQLLQVWQNSLPLPSLTSAGKGEASCDGKSPSQSLCSLGEHWNQMKAASGLHVPKLFPWTEQNLAICDRKHLLEMYSYTRNIGSCIPFFPYAMEQRI